MKLCPNCGRVYPDSGPDVCDDEGTPLLLKPAGTGEGNLVWEEAVAGEGREIPVPGDAGWSSASESRAEAKPEIEELSDSPPPARGKVCYFCDRTYPPQAQTCAEDGAILVDVGGPPQVCGRSSWRRSATGPIRPGPRRMFER